MNISKGINRIAIVLAILSILPAFIASWKIYKHENAVLVETMKERNLSELDKQKLSKQVNNIEDWVELVPTKEYSYPSYWTCVLAGLLGSIISFWAIFLIINGTTKTVFWIIEGFQAKK